MNITADTIMTCNICGNPIPGYKLRRVFDDITGEIIAMACPYCGSEDIDEV